MHTYMLRQLTLILSIVYLLLTPSFAQTPPFSFTSDPRDTLGRQLEFEQWRMIDPALGRVPYERLGEERERIISQSKSGRLGKQSAIPGMTWQERGPSNAGGRTRAVLFDPNDTTHKKVWAGSPSGGLWYTNDITDAAATWTPVSDNWGNMSVTCLAADPSNPQIMYAGTGDAYQYTLGGGIWKTINGGTTWERLINTTPSSVSVFPRDIAGIIAQSFMYIQRIIVTNSNTLFVATQYGLLRSTDGGASWQLVLSPSLAIGISGISNGLYWNDFVSDLEVGSDDILYVAFKTGRLFRSTNTTGTVWTEITPASGGQRTEIALIPSTNGESQIIYAVSTAYNTLIYSNDVKWFKKSTNGGSSWTDITIPTSSLGAHFTNGNGSTYLNLAVHPTDINTVYASGYGLFRSTNGGSNWSTQLINQGGYQQGIWVQPTSAGAVLDTQQGIRWSPDLGNNALAAPTLTNRDTGYRVSEIYSAAMVATPGSSYLLGTANTMGIIRILESGLSTGYTVFGGTSSKGLVFIDEDQAGIRIADYLGTFYLFSGESVTQFFSTRYVFSPTPADYDSQSNILYANDYLPASGYGIRRVTGVGGSSSSTFIPLTGETYLVAIKLGRNKESVFVGDFNSRIYKLTNLPSTTPTSVTIANESSLPPNSVISSIDVGATDNELLVTLSNYGISSVWYTSNGGVTWVNKDPAGSGLPDVPVRTGMFNPQNRMQVILGTDLGLWTTNDISATNPGWTLCNTGLPLIRVNQLRYRASDGRLVAATVGRGIFESNTLAVTYTPSSISLTGVSNRTLCIGSPLSVSFTTSGPALSGIVNYEVWISDKSGNFDNQQRIGVGVSSPISLTLPSRFYALPYGTNYQIKLVAPDLDIATTDSNYIFIGDMNGGFALDRVRGTNSIVCSNDQVRLTGVARSFFGATTPVDAIDAYQWLYNGLPISGATSQTCVATQPGTYQVQMQQAGCTIQSLSYSLSKSSITFIDIRSRFGSLPQCADSPSVLSTSYTGETASFQWKRDGIDIAGATSSTSVASQSGAYALSVTSSGCLPFASVLRMTFSKSLHAQIIKSDSVLCLGAETGRVSIFLKDIDVSQIGEGGYNVKWYRNNQLDNTSINRNSLSAILPGVYKAELSQGNCITQSNAIVVKQGVIIPPNILFSSAKTACPGDSRTMYLEGADVTYFPYQWQKDGIDIPNATGASYTAMTTGSYTVRAYKGSCNAVSQPITLTFTNSLTPEVNVQGNRSALSCGSIWLDARSYSGLSGTKFQWYKNNALIAGATNVDLNTGETGLYSVSVTNGNCTGLSKPLLSSPYTGTKPVINDNLTSLCADNTIQLTASQLSLSVQWKRNGIAIPYATVLSYYPTQSGLYSVQTSGNCGTFESDPVEIKIGEPTAATITGAALVSSGQAAVLPVALSGPAPWSFTLNTGQSVQNTYLNPYPLTITPSATTVYSIAAVQNACGSGTVFGQSTVTVGAGSADLTLSARVSSRTPKVNDVVSYSLIITNESQQESTGVQVTSRLPAGVDFVDAQTNGISFSDGVVSANVGAVGASSNITVSYRLRITQPGTFFTSAQVTATNTPDPDSQPNSGTGDGQDDAASVDLRTADAGGMLVASTNPNQVPLPRTQSSQPLVNSNTVELALSLISNTLTPKPYDVISLSLTVTNRGGATATNMVVQTVLPAGWQLTNIAGLVITGQTINAYIPQLAVGCKAVVVLSVQVGASGGSQIQAQIFDVTESVSNAKPGNGFQNGERDEAGVLIRVR